MHDREGFDLKDLTDGEVLDRIYELVADETVPQHEKLGHIQQLLEQIRTS